MLNTIALMPRKRAAAGEDATKVTKTDTVRVDGDLAQMATIIAIRRKTSVAELISPQLRPFLEAEYAKEVREMNREVSR